MLSVCFWYFVCCVCVCVCVWVCQRVPVFACERGCARKVSRNAGAPCMDVVWNLVKFGIGDKQ